jgi:hypothetical protein
MRSFSCPRRRAFLLSEAKHMENPKLLKSLIPPAWPLAPASFHADSEFKPIGLAAHLVLAKLAMRLGTNRAHADLQNGGSE